MTSQHSTDREALSALFDGELDGDARLFATRRLSHDIAWQTDCGRWQLIGDAMRRQAPIAAPAGLAARVRSDIDASPAGLSAAPVVSSVAAPTRRSYRLWAGGALAASVALMAVVAMRPSPTNTPAPAVAAAPAVSMPAAAASPIVAQPAVATASDATRVATLDAPAPRVERVGRTRERPSPTAARVASQERALAAAVAPAPALPVDANPFHVPTSNPLSTRPWPRASVGATAGAFTASYGATGDSRGESPSFFPFEPRPQAGANGQAETP